MRLANEDPSLLPRSYESFGNVFRNAPLDDVERLLRRLRKDDPESVVSRMGSLLLAFRRNPTRELAHAMERVLLKAAMDGEDASTVFALTVDAIGVYDALGDSDAVLALCDHATDRDPLGLNVPIISRFRGNALSAQRDWNGALHAYRDSLENSRTLRDKVQALVGMGKMYEQLKDHSSAMAVIQEALPLARFPAEREGIVDLIRSFGGGPR